AMHPSAVGAMQDHTRAQEADTRDDALDDPAYVRLRVLGDTHHRQRRSESNQPKRSHPRGLVMKLAIEADRAANQHRATEAKNDVRPLDHAIASRAPPIIGRNIGDCERSVAFWTQSAVRR